MTIIAYHLSVICSVCGTMGIISVSHAFEYMKFCSLFYRPSVGPAPASIQHSTLFLDAVSSKDPLIGSTDIHCSSLFQHAHDKPCHAS
jgi:hypothetical protein